MSFHNEYADLAHHCAVADFLYEKEGDPVGYLKEDFNGVPYISGLDELMEQRFAVFVTEGKNRNIVFHQK